MFIVDKIKFIKHCELSSVIITVRGSCLHGGCMYCLIGVIQIVYAATKQTTSTYCNYKT